MEMEKLVALCRRRGFLFQSSEIYGGLNGFWDYGPLGVELKRNIKEAWWRDMVTRARRAGEAGRARRRRTKWSASIASIIMHPQVWKCSGHYDLFCDMMVDCRQTKKRYRFDQVRGRWVEYQGQTGVRHDAAPRTKPKTSTARRRSCSSCVPRTPRRLRGTATIMSLAKVDDLSKVLAPGRERAGHAHRSRANST